MRHFEIKNKPYGENNGWRKCAVVHCSKCNREHFINVQTPTGIMPDEPIFKKLLTDGWGLARGSNGADVCPECIKLNGHAPVKIINEAKPKAPESHPSHLRIATGHVVDAPKEMSRDDRKLIYAQLDEVYVDEKTGYSKDWSDHRVSTYLQVPRVWVETVRSDMFGPLATNSETHQFLSEVDEAIKDGKDVFEEINKVKRFIDKFTNECGPIISRAAAAFDKWEALEKKANEIRKRGM